MDFIKMVYTIKDLENLSGIKTHTIRIWEKRYNLLSPERTDTNIRYYTGESLRKLLNVVLLYNNGYKISKIAKLNEEEILSHSKSLVEEQAVKNQFINDMKLAMLNFDQNLFEKAYQTIEQNHPFPEIFEHFFLPFLNEIGLLWQTKTINPAHEHFISYLIKLKVLVQSEKFKLKLTKNEEPKFVLFLPDNEIHDLGLTYLNYEIISRSYSTIFLGQSIPVNCLNSFTKHNEKLIFISYFTVKPEADKLLSYLDEISTEILEPSKSELWILGYQVQNIPVNKAPKRVKIFASVPELLKNI